MTASLAISAKNGFRSMSGASGSISAVTPGDAIWIRQSSGQKVVSRMNSVSTVTNSDFSNSRDDGFEFGLGGNHMHENSSVKR